MLTIIVKKERIHSIRYRRNDDKLVNRYISFITSIFRFFSFIILTQKTDEYFK